MENRLDKHHLKKEKVHSNFSWRLFSDVLFFKIGCNNQKLLTNNNGIPMLRNVSDCGEPRNVNMLSTMRRKSTDIEDRQEIEIHMEHEKNQVLRPLGLLLKDHKKTRKFSNKTPQKPMYHFKDEIFQSLTSSGKHIIAEMLEQIHLENGMDNTQKNPSNQYEFDQVKMQILQMKAQAFIDKIYTDRIKKGVNRESKQFLDAADILNVNMDLFLKLLQDPYPLFVKNIKNLQFLPKNSETTTKTRDKDVNNSWGKAKFVKQTSEHVSCHCSSLQSHHKSMKKDKGKIKRNSFSSLKDIFTRKKRENKKKCLLVKDKYCIKDASAREMLMNSSDEVHHKPVDMQPGNETVDIFFEAKRRLSERLKTVDSGDILHKNEAPRTLKMILSSRDSDLFESYSLKGHHNFDSDEKIFDLYRNHEITLDNSLHYEKAKRLSDDFNDDSLFGDVRTLNEEMQVFESTIQFSDNLNAVNQDLENTGSIAVSTANDLNNRGCHKTREYGEDSEYIQRLNLTSADEFPFGSSSNSSSHSVINKVKIMENIDERDEYRSPVSVLDPFSFEDIQSPTIESKLQPYRLNFEETEQDPISLYVRTLMEVSGLNLDEFSIKEDLHQDVLQSYIASEEIDCEIRFLLDCIHEAIAGVYERVFRSYPWKLLFKQKFKHFQEKEMFIDEVVKEVNIDFLSKMGKPDLDRPVMKETAEFSSWIDLHIDAEGILVQLAEDVLHDSILDLISEVWNLY